MWAWNHIGRGTKKKVPAWYYHQWKRKKTGRVQVRGVDLSTGKVPKEKKTVPILCHPTVHGRSSLGDEEAQLLFSFEVKVRTLEHGRDVWNSPSSTRWVSQLQFLFHIVTTCSTSTLKSTNAVRRCSECRPPPQPAAPSSYMCHTFVVSTTANHFNELRVLVNRGMCCVAASIFLSCWQRVTRLHGLEHISHRENTLNDISWTLKQQTCFVNILL